MKKGLIAILAALVVFAIAFVAMGPFYILAEGEQAVLVRLGKIVKTETNAGIKMRSPFLDVVAKFPKRILAWDGAPERIQTKENQFIWVDMTARWKIVDPARFYESVSTIENAYGRLDDVIDSAVRTVISANYLREAVRNSNELVGTTTKESFVTGDAEGSAALDQLTQSDIQHENIEKGRQRLSDDMLSSVKPIMPQFGIEVIDIIPRQIKYSDELTKSVYDRMIKERNKEAERYRSEGLGEKDYWLGKMQNELDSIQSGAYKAAETIKGDADAKAARIYALSYNQDPEFYSYWKALDSYRKLLPKFRKTLTTDPEYFKYLYQERAR